ncbi:hypothetical protein RRG08_058077 [Elysia crispata]|uniref:Uncharacterized protein n=1 Tax=Elysia crispata TaxID=231223 RepID=A0AAE0YHG8_9GAST|nr:hypothetical protein RRG08_058077 [Elysia crispata]
MRWKASIAEKSLNDILLLIREFPEIPLVIRWPLGSCSGYSNAMFIVTGIMRWKASIAEKSLNDILLLIREFPEIPLVIRWPLGSCSGYSNAMFIVTGIVTSNSILVTCPSFGVLYS